MCAPISCSIDFSMSDAEDTRLVAVADFLNRIDAEIAHSALEAAGIESFVSGDDAGGVQPGLWLEGVRLLVRDEDAGRALDVLNQNS
jgi:hypothetical protein